MKIAAFNTEKHSNNNVKGLLNDYAVCFTNLICLNKDMKMTCKIEVEIVSKLDHEYPHHTQVTDDNADNSSDLVTQNPVEMNEQEINERKISKEDEAKTDEDMSDVSQFKKQHK